MDSIQHIKEEGSPLFSLFDDEYLSSTKISKIISESMISIGVKHTSGHSLRIGGATELASKGVSQVNIENAGNWAPYSKARAGYVKKIGLANSRLTTTIMK